MRIPPSARISFTCEEFQSRLSTLRLPTRSGKLSRVGAGHVGTHQVDGVENDHPQPPHPDDHPHDSPHPLYEPRGQYDGVLDHHPSETIVGRATFLWQNASTSPTPTSLRLSGVISRKIGQNNPASRPLSCHHVLRYSS